MEYLPGNIEGKQKWGGMKHNHTDRKPYRYPCLLCWVVCKPAEGRLCSGTQSVRWRIMILHHRCLRDIYSRGIRSHRWSRSAGAIRRCGWRICFSAREALIRLSLLIAVIIPGMIADRDLSATSWLCLLRAFYKVKSHECVVKIYAMWYIFIESR